MSADNDVVQVIMQGIVLDAFKEWMRMRGLDAVRTQFDPDDIPTYSVVIKR